MHRVAGVLNPCFTQDGHAKRKFGQKLPAVKLGLIFIRFNQCCWFSGSQASGHMASISIAVYKLLMVSNRKQGWPGGMGVIMHIGHCGRV